MAEYSENPRYIVICGPTACKKSAVATAVAESLGGEIICGDSMQIYSGLEIGTAAPGEDEKSRMPHRLYGMVDPAESYSVARYVAEARQEVARCAESGAVPIVCGGTGLYIDALTSGLAFDAAEPDPALREAIRREYEAGGIAPLMREIIAADPESANTLDERNVKRVLRAVELLRTSGMTTRRQTELTQDRKKFGRALVYVLAPQDREALYRRCDERVDMMLQNGLLDEARYVYENRDRFATAAQAIGYKELFGYIEGVTELGQCVETLKRATRRYAKRQLTWFRRESGATFIDPLEIGTEKTARRIANDWRGGL